LRNHEICFIVTDQPLSFSYVTLLVGSSDL